VLTSTETADVSGSLDGVPFTDNELTLKASGDTSGVSGGPSFFFLYVPLTRAGFENLDGRLSGFSA
jgi:hypothetical protein